MNEVSSAAQQPVRERVRLLSDEEREARADARRLRDAEEIQRTKQMQDLCADILGIPPEERNKPNKYEMSLNGEITDEDLFPKKEPVGYKSPPKHSQFKKGRSGNPSGRPKGVRNLRTSVENVLTEIISVNTGGKLVKVSKFEAMCMQHSNKALKGDHRAFRWVCDTVKSLGLFDKRPQTLVMHNIPALSLDELKMLERLLSKASGEYIDI
jgi:hypothetical protein